MKPDERLPPADKAAAPGVPLSRLVVQSLGDKRRYLPAVIALGILAAAFEGVGIGLIIPVLGIIAGGEDAGGAAGRFFGAVGAGLAQETRLVLLAGLIIVLVMLKNAVSYANAVLVGYLYGHAGDRTRRQIARQILTVGFGFILAERPGRILNVLSNESWRLSDSVQVTLNLVVSLAASVIFFAFLLFLSWQMTLVVAAGLLFVQGIHWFLSLRLKQFGRLMTRKNNLLSSDMLHLVHSGRLVRLFQQEEAEQKGFEAASDAVRRAALALDRRQAALPATTEVLYALLFLGVVGVAWSAGNSFPLIASFVVLLYRMQPQVRAAQANWAHLHSWTGSLEEVRWLLDKEDKPAAPSGSIEFSGLRDRIAFERVDFSYSGSGQKVLHCLQFKIRSGRATALVGRSGAGKSTIVNLLCRFLEPTAGMITVDGNDLASIKPDQWRASIALASQDLELAEGTIADNIAYGAPDATREDIEAAARMAQAHDFITAFAQGYETRVGYRGTFLSAGQRQRIALARALVRDPDILILDEATNALDGISEAAIVDTLRLRAGRATTIVISHHQSTIKFCDDLVELENGCVKQVRTASEISLALQYDAVE